MRHQESEAWKDVKPASPQVELEDIEKHIDAIREKERTKKLQKIPIDWYPSFEQHMEALRR